MSFLSRQPRGVAPERSRLEILDELIEAMGPEARHADHPQYPLYRAAADARYAERIRRGWVAPEVPE